MRNPNEVTFTTRTTSTSFITEYAYSVSNGMFSYDFARFVELYGVDNVEAVGFGKHNYIIVTQPLFTNDVIRLANTLQ
jgi:hypothetical protein